MDTVQHTTGSIDWKPTPVVALATSVDGSRVAAARQDGTVEIWLVSPGSVDWHCQLTINGDHSPESRISSLVWCRSGERGDQSGRLFSSSIDGSITEWDLYNLRHTIALESIGTSIWQMALQPCDELTTYNGSESQSNENGTVIDSYSNGYASGSSYSDDDDDSIAELRESLLKNSCVALACDDGCVRLYTVSDTDKFIPKKSLPRVSGRMLSVTWSHDGNMIFSGSSDGLIRCWDAKGSIELYRTPVGIGGLDSVSELCVWSLLALRSGTLVSADSSGSVQFWDCQKGTFLQSHSRHKGDANALAAEPSHNMVFSAGSDGKVILYKLSRSATTTTSSNHRANSAADGVKNWVHVGDVRSHTHDVRALIVATPVTEEGPLPNKKGEKYRRKEKSNDYSYHKWAHMGVPMLLSAGDDTKLFAYSAKEFLKFVPHDICPAPQRVPLQLVPNPVFHHTPLLLAQGASCIDILSICLKDAFSVGKGSSSAATKLETRVTCSGRISCSAISQSGSLVSYSSNVRTSLFELKKSKISTWTINKRKLPSNFPCARSMTFTSDSLQLIIAGLDGRIYVVDAASSELLYVLTPRRKDRDEEPSPGEPPIVRLLVSSNAQWLASVNCFGDIYIFDLKMQRQHWFISRLDGASVTAGSFHPQSNNVLVITTSSNQLHKFDVEAKQWGRWSKRDSLYLPQSFLNIPGEVIGLSFPLSTSTPSSVVVYSSRAMCTIDLEPMDGEDSNNQRLINGEFAMSRANGGSVDSFFGNSNKPLMNGTSPKPRANGGSVDSFFGNSNKLLMNGTSPKPRANGRSVDSLTKKENTGTKKRKLDEQNAEMYPKHSFSNPVLFVGHLSKSSMLVVDKPWKDVVKSLEAAPVHRHIYGN